MQFSQKSLNKTQHQCGELSLVNTRLNTAVCKQAPDVTKDAAKPSSQKVVTSY